MAILSLARQTQVKAQTASAIPRLTWPAGNQLQPVGPVHLSIPLSIALPPAEKRLPARPIQQERRHLIQAYPETVPALAFLEPDTEVSRLVTSYTSAYDTLIGRRLAFGHARCYDNGYPTNNLVSVLAAATGDAGGALRLIRVSKSHLGWSSSKNMGLVVPSLATGEESLWSGSGSPVRQVCFAQADGEGGSWMAVRLDDSTTIFRPVYHRVPSNASQPKELPQRSPLDPCPLVSLSHSVTGGAPHADVTFNPWYHRQVSLVDQRGYWTVWEVEGKMRKRRNFKATPVCSGSISHDVPISDSSNSPPQADGWGSVCWATNIRTLVVCDRRHLAIFDLAPTGAVRLEPPDLGLHHSPHWILDVRRSVVHENHLFVLTSSQVFWLEIASAIQSEVEGGAVEGSRILLSWVHFRNPEDTSLQLEVQRLDDGESSLTCRTTTQLTPRCFLVSLVLLHSRISHLVTVFQFALDPALDVPLSVSDPYEWVMPQDLVETTPSNDPRPGESQARTISNLFLLPLKYWSREAPRGPRGPKGPKAPKAPKAPSPAGPEPDYQENGVKFYQCLISYNDLAVSTSFYASGALEDESSFHWSHVKIPFPDVTIRRFGLPPRSDTWASRDDKGSDPSDSAEDHEVVSRTVLKASTTPFDRARKRSGRSAVDAEWLYNLAFTLDSSNGESRTAKANSIPALPSQATSDSSTSQAFLQKLQQSLESKRIEINQPLETL